MAELRICKDCRWAKNRLFSTTECHHPVIGPKPEKTDVVTGKTENSGYWSCDVNRMHSSDGCGHDGKLWEARQ